MPDSRKNRENASKLRNFCKEVSALVGELEKEGFTVILKDSRGQTFTGINDVLILRTVEERL